MAKNKNEAFAVVLLLLFGVIFTLHIRAPVLASQKNVKSPSGVTISPAYQQVSIDSTESQHSISFNITNNESTTRTYNLGSADFNTLNETGGLFFVGSNPTELQKKYGLAKWLKLPQSSVTVQPKHTDTVIAQILNLPDLSPGGHYGALMIEAQGKQAEPSASDVSVHPVASSLLFVTKAGGDTHKMALSSADFSHNLFSLPSSVTLRFHNDGNTHLIPRGVVYVYSPGGKLVSKGIINDDSGIILPELDRRYYVPLQQVSKPNVVGKYRLRVDFRFDGIDQFRTYQASFVYLPPVLTGVLIITMAIIATGSAWLYKILVPKKKRKIKVEVK